MSDNEALARLTEREKECLRFWLEHKTAKEIALDLGISHYAVEKRLKMARTKLRVTTSLEAARLLAESERYEQLVPQAPDLSSDAETLSSTWHPLFVFGGIAMILTVLSVFALTATVQTVPEDRVLQDGDIVELSGNIQPLFDDLDEDGSGFLEQPESPFVTLVFVDPASENGLEGEAVLGDAADPEQVSEFYAEADADGDSRVSFREYYAWHRNSLAEMGIEMTSILRIAPAPQS